MADAPYKIVATEQNFAQAVIEASERQPVLIDFWAPWCGPCRTLMPMLDHIADDYGGRFVLAKVNTDEDSPSWHMLTQECAHKESQKRSQEHKAYDLQGHALRQCTALNVFMLPWRARQAFVATR